MAGCGTSQAAKVALRWPRAQVIGIDVSTTGIEETEKLKRKHRIENLELRQLPLERATELGRSFEYVICTGVLHHLPDPDTGLRALHDALAPDGVEQADGGRRCTVEQSHQTALHLMTLNILFPDRRARDGLASRLVCRQPQEAASNRGRLHTASAPLQLRGSGHSLERNGKSVRNGNRRVTHETIVS